MTSKLPSPVHIADTDATKLKASKVCNKTTKYPRFALGLFVIIAIVFVFTPLMEVKYFSVVPDEAFMALNVQNYLSAPLAPLTFYMGHVATYLSGDGLITLRLLKYICYFISIGLACLYFLKTTNNILAASGLFAILMFSSGSAGMDIYNWDTGSYPFMVAALIATLVFLKLRNGASSVLMGAASAFMIASRITNITAIPFIVLLICLCRMPVMKRVKLSFIYIGSLISFLILCALFIYGSLSTLLDAWAPENIITGHGADMVMLKRMLTDFNTLSLYLTLGYAVSIICLFFTYVTLRLCMHRIIPVILMILMLFLYARALRFDQSAHYGIWQLPALLFLFMPQLSAIISDKQHTPSIVPTFNLRQWTILLFLLLPAVGSDHFYERFAPLVFIPIVIANGYSRFSRQFNIFFGFMALVFVFLTMLKLPVRLSGMTNDIGSISPRTEGILYKDISTLSMQKDVYDRLKASGYNPTFVGERKPQWTYMFAPKSDYSLTHFHYIDFNSERNSYLKHLTDYDALIINLPVYDGRQMSDFLNFLSANGYDDISCQMHLPSSMMVFVR